MKIEIDSIEEARAICHCLVRTSARNNYGNLTNILDHCEKFEEKLQKIIDGKFISPQSIKDDLEYLFEDQKNIQYPILYKREDGIEVQLTGLSISLKEDGTYFINDTSGG